MNKDTTSQIETRSSQNEIFSFRCCVIKAGCQGQNLLACGARSNIGLHFLKKSRKKYLVHAPIVAHLELEPAHTHLILNECPERITKRVSLA